MKIRIHINKIGFNDVMFAFVLCILLLYGYFSGSTAGFAWASPMWNTGIGMMFFAILISNIRAREIERSVFWIITVGFVIFFLFLSVNYYSGVDLGYGRKNILGLMKVIVTNLSIMMLKRSKKFDFFNAIKKCFWLFNIWGIINMFVLVMQINVRGFAMQPAWLTMNSYYEDLCAGLFGYNGTEKLGLYMIFLFIYNLYIAEFEIKQKKRKIKIYIYNFMVLMLHFILSTQNDNMAIYLLTIIFFVSYMYLNLHWKKHSIFKSFGKWVKYIIVLVVVFIVLLTVPITKKFILDGVFQRILRYKNTTASTGSGSNERVAILLYSLDNGFGWKLGKGIGYYPFGGINVRVNRNLGFPHFGLSSMSSIVYLMGIWFHLFYVFWMSKIYHNMSRGEDRVLLCFIVLIMLFLSFYTNNLTSTTISVCLTMIFSVFGMMEKSINNEKFN